jgi:diguanylate cyclase (GGDEF)-like protein/PAS domain S-box-containing protein
MPIQTLPTPLKRVRFDRPVQVWAGLFAGAAAIATLMGLGWGLTAGLGAFTGLATLLMPLVFWLATRSANALGQQSQRLAEAVEGHAFFQATFENAGIGMGVVNARGEMIRANPAMCRLLGYRHDELLGMRLSSFTHPDDQAAMRQFTQLASGEIDHYTVEKRYICKHGEVVPVRVNATAVRHRDGHATYFLGQIEDISDQKSLEQHLRQTAARDSLTGLGNRTAFTHQITEIGQWLEQSPDRVFSVLYLDLDGFKLINDTLGHKAGDRLLMTVAHYLNTCLERCAEEHCIGVPSVARLGGDEFTAILQSANQDTAEAVAQAVLNAIDGDYQLRDRAVRVGASIGVATASSREACSNILEDADIAMYDAKRHAPHDYRVFDRSMKQKAERRLDLEHELRRALDQDQLEVAYQPSLAMDSGRTVGFEALARWHHPTRGPISPSEFIPLAEEAGLIEKLIASVLQQATRQLAGWRRETGRDLRIAVNVSPMQLHGDSLAGAVDTALEAADLPSTALKLEVTENLFLQEGATDKLQALVERGVRLSLDDFGTGFSSLSMLHRLPLGELKLDRTLLQQATERGACRAVIHAVVTLAHHLGLTVVAEGIESRDQLALLQGCDCDYGQGYLPATPRLRML